ncbi:MAG TPA: GNAT family protein [Pseudonocardiaceae bacterium]
MSDPTYRPLRAGEHHRYESYGPPPASGVGVRSRSFAQCVGEGEYPPGWVWIAERDGAVVARAAFWAPPGHEHPHTLDFFDPPAHGDDRVEVGAALLRAAYAALVPPDYRGALGNDRPDYHLLLPTDWRERPDALADAELRLAAAEAAGLEFFVERLSLRWTPERGLPPRPGRLRMTPVAPADDATAVDLLARLCAASLDAYALRDVRRYGLRDAAVRTLADTEEYGDRRWWRIGRLPDGEPVGIVLPVRVTHFATHAYVGVVPEHRGHRYSEDLVIEGLHLFTEAGETLVQDATDVANTPMAAAFDRIGYELTGRRIVML